MSVNADKWCYSNICSDKTFRETVLAQLDQIAAALEGISFEGDFPVVSATTWLPITIVPFGDLTNAFVEFLTNDQNIKYILFENRTDQTVYISFDGVEINGILRPNGSWTLNLANNFAIETNSIFLSYLTETAPADGNVEISAYY